ncbi:MAG: DJ-1/PfpI family protein, partial [Sporosarcina sp.]
KEMADRVADGIGVNRPTGEQVNVTASSPALSQENTIKVPYTLKVGVLIGNGFTGAEVKKTVKTLRKYGVTLDIVGEKQGKVRGTDGLTVMVNDTFLTMDPVLFDALYVVGGTADNQAKFNFDIQYFINESFRHYKPIGFASTGVPFFSASNAKAGPGIVFATNDSDFDKTFVKAIATQRFWNRDIY